MQNKHFSQLQAIISAQEELQPSPVVKQRIMAKIRQPAQSWLEPAFRWATGVAVAVLIALVLWIVIQPGVVLEWSGSPNTATKVYRASLWNGELQLLAEAKASSQSTQYQFTDPWLVPSLKYTYVIESSTVNGQSVQRAPITVNSLETFTIQITILLTSLILGYGIFTIRQEMPLSPRKTALP